MEENTTQLAPSEDQVVSQVQSVFGGDVEHLGTRTRRVTFKVSRGRFYEMCEMMRDQLNFQHCTLEFAVDYETHVQNVVLLTNYENGIMAEVRTDMPNDDLTVASVTPLWGGANWHERETAELFGIDFEGHPDMRKLLLPEDYRFFPFRKSFKVGRLV